MTFRFTKKEILILVLSLLLTAILIFVGYTYYLNPKQKDVETKTASLKSEQDVLAALQQKQTDKSSLTVENIAVLQRKVPVKAQLEQLILDLEKAEVVSGTVIKNMTFAEADVAAATPPQTTETNQSNNDAAKSEENGEADEQNNAQQAEGTQQTDQTNQQADQTGQTGTAPVAATPLPAGIKKLTVTLQVESDNYDELKAFLETLENLQRAVVIETVGFSGGGEVTNLDSENKKLSYSLTISAFYMPALTDLQDKLPELVTPPPANKTYPFSSFPNVTE
ncbi:hypothetical protein [Neobacillus sp. LXY-4]|uniref:hypothetical protein n=1 Tax=Neobacillus sp. LXY-4 TaxID=3379826 RepID=UPI003EE31D83